MQPAIARQSGDLPALIGRDHERAAINALLEDACAGRPGMVLLSGEAGVGKSRLVAAAIEEAGARGARILQGYAIESGGMPPHFPLSRAFNRIADAAEFADLVPVLAAAGVVSAPVPPPPTLSPEAERLRLFEALTTLCARLAAVKPLVLTLDDLHWAEAAFWDALVYLARSLERVPLAIVLALRGEALHQAGAPAARAVAELNRLRLLHHLPLACLSTADIGRLTAAMLGGAITPTLGAIVAGRSDGNPFFAEEILRDLLDRRAVLQRDGVWDIDPTLAMGRSSMPASLRLAIQERFARFPEETCSTVLGAAVLGRTFETATLAVVSGRDRDQTEVALLPALAAGFVRESEGSWSFLHDTIREAVYEGSTGERRRLHAAAALALSVAGETQDRERLATLAHHWRCADDADKAATALLSAARAATAAHAPDEALAYARDGRGLRERAEAGRSPSAAVAAARLQHGEAALAADSYVEADAAFRGALTEARALSDDVLAGLLWARLGVVARRREQPDEAAGCFTQALAILDNGADSVNLAETLIEFAGLQGITRARYHEAEALGERGLQMAARLSLPVLEAQAALTLAGVRIRAVDPTAGRPLLVTALERALAGNDLSLATEACAALSNSHYWTGEIRAAQRYAMQRLECAERAGDAFGLRHAHSWLALLAVARGEWKTARTLLITAEPLLRRLDNPEPIAFLRIVEALIEQRCGDLNRAVALADEAITLFERVDPATVLWYAGLPALIRIELGRVTEARELLAAQESRLASLPDAALPARSARVLLGLCYAAIDDRARGAACEAALRQHAGDFHWHPARRTLAALAALRGDTATALADLARTEEQARREGMQPDLALTLLARAALLPPGDGTRERDLVEARGLLTALEMHRALEQVERLRHPEHHSTGLSARELEVLRLVATGMTNREIAATLVLSERTVINHISHIFAKIGVDNRAGAAAFALRQGLA